MDAVEDGFDEIEALFGACAADRSPAGSRDAALFAVLYGAGLRRGELCGLDIEDLDVVRGVLAVRKGKGSSERSIYLNPEAVGHVVAWLEVRGMEPGPMFCPVNCAGRVRVSRLRGESVYYIVQRRQRETGFEGVTPHGLRRSFVTGLLEAGVDVFTVQKLAGHAHVMTTACYDRRGEQATREATRALRIPRAG